MELYRNSVREEQNIEKERTGETVISVTTEQESTMNKNENKWYENSSKYNGERPVYPLLNKHRSSSEKINDSRETNKISIQISKSTVNLDNTLGEKSYVSSQSINNFLEIRPLETPSKGKEDFVWSNTDRFPENQTKVIEFTTGFRFREPAHAFTEREWKSVDTNGITLELRQLCRNQCVASVIPVEARPSDKDGYNFNRNTKNKLDMQELPADIRAQYEYDLPTLLKLLKDKYPFHDETNKNILDDYEIKRFAKLYCITNFYPVLSYDDLIFWLKNSDGVTYIWSRTDEMMIHGGCNMKEALVNFLFCQKNLCYIEDYTLELIPVLKAKDEAKKWYKESKNTEIEFVVNDESLKPLEEKKKGSKKGRKQKKQQKRKNKH